jgi:replicative DNA helicase Mcm
VGDPGTGKCLKGDTKVTLGDGQRRQIRDLVEENLDDPKPVDDGVYDTVDITVPSMTAGGQISQQRATKVWKRESPEKMYRIRTASGRELEITPSHPLFVQSEGEFVPRKAEELAEGDEITVVSEQVPTAVSDGGTAIQGIQNGYVYRAEPKGEAIDSIETVEPDYDWVYDLEVAETHTYISDGVISHNSQLLQYIKEIAPRSVYTSGKGSSSAGLTAAAVRDDFGEGQQWTLEAGALVLADQGIAAVDELDKMRCVTGDTMVHTPTGMKPIKEIADQAEQSGGIEKLENGQTIRDVDQTVWTMADDETIERQAVTAVHEYDAPDSLRAVTLESGESVTTTPDHPFFVFDDGNRTTKPAEELEPNDLVYTPQSPPEMTDGGTATSGATNDIGEFDERRDVTLRRVETVETVASDVSASVYDLTIECTHNFVANNIIIHNSEDQSAMHEALEQQSISVSKAGINATLKSRCSLLGAANPTYGRFDEFEPIGEQIDLAPPLISRFDLIFTVTDQPDEEKDNELAEHILQTNYAGELNTHRTETNTSNYTEEEVERVTEDVAPTIEAEFLRKYVAYAQRNCYPTMTEDAKSAIQDFYVELRMQGSDEDAPVPVTARKLEAMVRLAEASARVRLSDTVTEEDAQRAIDIARYSLEDIGLDPETGELDADMIETGTSKSQRDRIKNVLQLIEAIEDEYDEGAPVDVVIERAEEEGMDTSKAEHEIDKLKQKGEVYEPRTNHLRTT